ncbi:unnamed protein product [Symbiodinium sp. CCMP2592]|nr:unnamed protein product [Symbiodinium sp. CCMP2592]
MSGNGDGCHWELPLAIDDFPADGIVQVLSDRKAATAALMAVNLKSKELRQWLGQVVKIVEKSKKSVKCQQLQTTNRKAPSIWLAPAALTKPLASEQDLVRRNLAGIYRAARRRLDNQSTMHVHILCPEASEGAEICCREAGRDGEPILMQGGAGGLFWCTLSVGPTFKDQQKLKFILNKDKRMGVMESLESFLGSFRGRNDHGNLLETDVALSRQAADDARFFGQVLFDSKEELPQVELHGRFLCAFHHRLEGENSDALPVVLGDFLQLCKQMRSTPDLKEYLNLLADPISSSQAVLAMCALARLVKLPTDAGTFARGELVLVERAKGSNSKSKKGQGERSEASVGEVVQASQYKLRVRKLSGEVAGEEEEVHVDRVKPLSATCTWSGVGSISSNVLSAFAACSCKAQDFHALLQQDCWRGLQTMLRADAYRGGAWWLEAVRLALSRIIGLEDLGERSFGGFVRALSGCLMGLS